MENVPSKDSHSLFIYIYGKSVYLLTILWIYIVYIPYIHNLFGISRIFAGSLFCTGLMLVRMGGKSL